MDHDILMMIYGALIGVGSSIVTTLFQSWLARRERERTQKQERESTRKQIYIPTQEEILRIKTHKRGPDDWTDNWSGELGENSTLSPIRLLVSIAGVIVFLVIAGKLISVGFLSKPTFYLIETALITFVISFRAIQSRKN